nr:DUF2390 domain-containing protein [Martelella sp.]|tara:strand:+ start:536 stop:958 length:423 start_codon:yes stop_codon:yes gene_type:complete
MKTQRPLDPHNPFWTDILALYRRDGVSGACLSLQDSHEIDVVLLLFFRLCDTRHLPLDDDMLVAAEVAVEPWRKTSSSRCAMLDALQNRLQAIRRLPRTGRRSRPGKSRPNSWNWPCSSGFWAMPVQRHPPRLSTMPTGS